MELQLNKISVLYSYAYLKNQEYLEKVLLELSAEGYINLMVDSGAFTAYKSGNPIDLKAYIEACKRYDGKVWQYVALDVVFRPEDTFDNLNKMAVAGLKPMPVLVNGVDVSLTKELKKFSEYVCVPGGTLTKGDYMRQRFQQVAKYGVKIHGLGYMKFPEMYQLPLYSIDSSTWADGRMYGTFCKFDKETGFERYSVKDLRKSRHGLIPKGAKQLWTDAGLAPKDRFKKELFTGLCSFNGFSNTNAFIDMAKFSSRKGLEYFFVCTDFGLLAMLVGMTISRNKYDKWKYYETEKMVLKLNELYKRRDCIQAVKELLT